MRLGVRAVDLRVVGKLCILQRGVPIAFGVGGFVLVGSLVVRILDRRDLLVIGLIQRDHVLVELILEIPLDIAHVAVGLADGGQLGLMRIFNLLALGGPATVKSSAGFTLACDMP